MQKYKNPNKAVKAMEKVEFPFDTNIFFERYVTSKALPKNDFEKQAILMRIIKDFEDKRIYKEEEVNDIVKNYFEDFSTIRRELINFGYLQRDSANSNYWVTKRELTKEDIQKNTRLKRHFESYNLKKEK